MAVWENPPADGMARKNPPARQATPLAASSWSLSIGGSSGRRTVPATEAVSRKHMMAIANAPPSSSSTESSRGRIGVGSPDGTGAIRLTPCSSSDQTATRTMPSPTATSGAGTRGTKRASPSRTASVAADSATVTQLISPRSSRTPRSSAKKAVAAGSPVIPSSLGSWPAATVSPTPSLMPVSVASEMLSMSPPSRSRRAPTRMSPTRIVSVARSRAGSSLDAATDAVSSVDPVSTATVDVVLTDSVRDPPSSAYTTIGTMHV